MTEAAAELGVTNHVIRRLIRDGDLQAYRSSPEPPIKFKPRIFAASASQRSSSTEAVQIVTTNNRNLFVFR